MHLRDAATRSKRSGRGVLALSWIFRSPLNLNASAGDSLIARPAPLKIGYLFLLGFSVCYPSQAQTYEIGPSVTQLPSSSSKSPSHHSHTLHHTETLRWGSSI